ncbi:DUF3761 domain-containing protein [Serratia marcescens]|uniref:DUF3761 domain-containing protein n=1 Tax=Serratia marcescens TaxID=615 RepID=UPI00178810B4|nr:DUF3761 domain-containing protein [Serratia marcescens]
MYKRVLTLIIFSLTLSGTAYATGKVKTESSTVTNEPSKSVIESKQPEHLKRTREKIPHSADNTTPSQTQTQDKPSSVITEKKSVVREKSQKKTNHPTTPSVSKNPGDATARCHDGSFSFSKQHSGTCSRHGGVEQWLNE